MQKRKHARHAKNDQIEAKIKKELKIKKYLTGNLKKNAKVPNLPNL